MSGQKKLAEPYLANRRKSMITSATDVVLQTLMATNGMSFTTERKNEQINFI